MKLVTSYKEAAVILKNSEGREPREITEHKKAITELATNKHLYTTDGKNIFVAQRHTDYYDNKLECGVWGWILVDWYLECDTESIPMTGEEIKDFEKAGGVIRT